jgi:hypothetical protein
MLSNIGLAILGILIMFVGVAAEKQRAKIIEKVRKDEALEVLSNWLKHGYERIHDRPDLKKEALAILAADDLFLVSRFHEKFLPYGIRDWLSSVAHVTREILHEKSGFFPPNSQAYTIETLYKEINMLNAALKKHNPNLGLNVDEKW